MRPTIPPQNISNSSNSSNSRDKTPQQTLWDRIHNSASTLIHDAVIRPSGAAMGADLAQVLEGRSSGKSYPFSSSSSSSTHSDMMKASYSASSSSTFADDIVRGGSFRSSALSSDGNRDIAQEVYNFFSYNNVIDSHYKGKVISKTTIPIHEQQKHPDTMLMSNTYATSAPTRSPGSTLLQTSHKLHFHHHHQKQMKEPTAKTYTQQNPKTAQKLYPSSPTLFSNPISASLP